MVRHPRQEEIQPVRLTVTTRRVPSRFVASPLLIVYAFIALIAVGTVLLLMPFANLIFLVLNGTRGANRFGADPKIEPLNRL